MDDNIIQEGIELMAVGMGVVFSFLILMVVFISLCGAFFTKYSSWFTEPPAPTPAPVAPRRAITASAKIAVAVAAAHRKKFDS